MFRMPDSLLDRVTMYRLALYYLLFLVLYAAVLGLFGILPWGAGSVLISAAVLTAASWVSNKVFARVFRADDNIESSLITGLILALLFDPQTDIFLLLFAGFAASGSKYLFAPQKKHIFNPAAFAVFATGSVASWWVGSYVWMLPPVFLGGLLVARKLRAGALVLSFFFSSLAILYIKGGWEAIPQTFYYAPLFFFMFIMLTEPSTTPPKKLLGAVYGALVGLLSNFFTYELALLLGNIFSYAVSAKYRLVLRLKEKKEAASAETYEFSFLPSRKAYYEPGQYMEWTLKHPHADARGVRRFFTIASSPTEPEIKLGVKFYPQGSTFKKALMALPAGGRLSAGRIAGDFTMPKNKNAKLLFIAGGIGITPFRSMIKYVLDSGEKRDIVLLYSNRTASEIAFGDIFRDAGTLGVRSAFINNDKDGYITEEIIKREAPDWKERTFYISGPHAMVTAFEKTLRKMGVPGTRIKTDFFPGYA